METIRKGNAWKHTSTVSIEDFPKVALVANEVY